MSDRVRHASADTATSEVFRRLAEIVYNTDDFSAIYRAIVTAAPHLVEGCDHASLMLRWDGRFVTAASSDEVAETVDRLERELGEGPCLDAISNDSVYLDADLANGSPWPRLAEQVMAQTPVRGMAGFRLRAGEGRSGALNLFSDASGGLTDRAIDQGIVLAAFVTVALVAASERRSASTLKQGLESNREIGKAVGLLMAFHHVSDEEAFAMLRTASQDLNLKLSEVAQQVVANHNTV